MFDRYFGSDIDCHVWPRTAYHIIKHFLCIDKTFCFWLGWAVACALTLWAPIIEITPLVIWIIIQKLHVDVMFLRDLASGFSDSTSRVKEGLLWFSTEIDFRVHSFQLLISLHRGDAGQLLRFFVFTYDRNFFFRFSDSMRKEFVVYIIKFLINCRRRAKTFYLDLHDLQIRGTDLRLHDFNSEHWRLSKLYSVFTPYRW